MSKISDNIELHYNAINLLSSLVFYTNKKEMLTNQLNVIDSDLINTINKLKHDIDICDMVIKRLEQRYNKLKQRL